MIESMTESSPPASSSPDFSVRPASADEIDVFAALLTRVALHLRATDRAMWTPESTTKEVLLSRFCTPDEMFLGFLDGEAVATMLLQERDPYVWPDHPEGEALYLHRLSVAPEFTGRGLAVRMLDAARTEAARRGKMYLRLDTGANRPKLRALYEGYGFRCIDERARTHYTAVRYELPLTNR